jgi:hypothetical protein
VAVFASVRPLERSGQTVAELAAFRDALLGCFVRRADALFELTDVVLAAGPVPSLPHLSLDPLHRRGHGSTYAALARGRINTEALRDLLAAHHMAAAPIFVATDAIQDQLALCRS